MASAARPNAFVSDVEYAEWLRAELDRVMDRNYRRILSDPVFATWAEQGRLFALDTIQVLKSELLAQPWGSHLTLLDVGAGCGAGTALLASFFADPALGYTIRCEALEPLAQHWAELYPVMYRDLPLRTEMLDDVADGSYDIVTASHVIEHIPRAEVGTFVRTLMKKARKFVIVACPWQEVEPRCPGHLFSADDALIAELTPSSFTTYRSLGWNNPGPDWPHCLAMVFRCPEPYPLEISRDRFWFPSSIHRLRAILDKLDPPRVVRTLPPPKPPGEPRLALRRKRRR